MNKTKPRLMQGQQLNPDTGQYFSALGFMHDDDFFITSPRMSECGRFVVDPLTYYRLTPEQLAELDADTVKRYRERLTQYAPEMYALLALFVRGEAGVDWADTVERTVKEAQALLGKIEA